MKRLLLLLPLLCFLASCKKDQELSDLKNQIAGTWELESIYGFWSSGNFPSGNGKTITIRNDGTYERRDNNNIVYKGNYSLKKKKDCYERTSNNAFITGDYNGELFYIELKDQKLIISPSNCIEDESTFVYRRI